MESLASKYRPQSYADVEGQTEAVNSLVPLVQRRAALHYLFMGETGTGKTSLALITARAYRCTGDRNENLPCTKCSACTEIGLGPQFGFESHPAPNLSTGMLDDIVSNAGFVGLTGPHTVFIDEAHALKPAMCNKLLTVLEQASSTIFMFATDQPEELEPRLLHRLWKVRLSPMDFETSFRHLKDVCAKEGFIYDKEGLELIVEVSAGSARALLENLDEVSTGGELITPDLVRSRLKLDCLRPYVPALVGLIEGDQAKSVATLNKIVATPRAKAEALRTLIVQIHENAILGLSRPGLGIAGIEPQIRRSIADTIVMLATRRGISPDELVHHLATQLTPAEARVDDTWLKTKLLGLKVLIHSEPVYTPTTSRLRLPSRALKRKVGQRARDAEGYVSKEKVASILDAASFLAQAYGKLLNFRLMFFHDKLQIDQSEASQLIARCVHELGMRVKSWSRGAESLHYIYLHQLSAKVGFNTTVVGSIPVEFAFEVGDWLSGFLHRVLKFEGASASVRLKFHRVEDPESRLRQHWRFIRSLCRNIDPSLCVELDGRPQTIVNLLKVDRRICEPIGALSVAHPIRMSASLSAKEMKTSVLAFISAFRDGAWKQLQSGWELREFIDRERELEKLGAQVRRISEEFEKEPGVRDRELQSLYCSIPRNPYDRERTWTIWRMPATRISPRNS